MSGAITLTPKAPFKGLFNGEALSPDRLVALSAADLARVTLAAEGSTPVALGDCCSITGSGHSTLRLEGDWSAVRGVGAGMKSGRLEIMGNAGDDLGAGMTAGAILVRGNAGHNIGGARGGASKGMLGGDIIVFGNSGNNTGTRMRRGTIFIGGSAGDGAGQSIIAGTLVLAGSAGRNLGLWNKRGSIIALAEVAIPVAYRYACRYHPPAVPLLLGRLVKRYGVPITPEQVAGLFARYSGDLAESGKGEILTWMAAPRT